MRTQNVLVTLVLSFCVTTQIVGAEAQRPNILLFIGDNWAWPHAGVLGDPTVKTPVFDALAADGMLMTHAFCPVPSCSPTRSCLLTGRVAHQLEDAASLWSAFPQKFTVFTQLLQAAGYEIGYSGKGWSPGRYLEYGWEENPAGPKFKDFAEFLEKRDASKPFFFWSGNVDAALHRWQYELSGCEGLDPNSVKVPANLPDTPEVRRNILAYYGGVVRMDRDAGDVIGALEPDLAKQTCVVYCSDNGWQMPRGLANCYDTGTRIPCAIRWPGHVDPGTKSAAFVSLTDLAPTFLEMAGVEIPAEMTGRSFVDVMTGRHLGARRTVNTAQTGQAADDTRDHIFLERERHANVRHGDLSYPMRCLRTREFLYIWNMRPTRWPAGDPIMHQAVGDYGDVDFSWAKHYILTHLQQPEMNDFYAINFGKRPAEELYDLRTDPEQLHNVADVARYAEIRATMKQRVWEWMQSTADPRCDPNCDLWDAYPYFGNNRVRVPNFPDLITEGN